ncbi:MAG: Do family serine endopeptidase [Gammaproteobacteria bacterium]
MFLPASGVLAAGLPDFTALVNKVSPVVVNVSTIQRPDTLARDDGAAASNPNANEPYPDWYRRYFDATAPDDSSSGDSEGDTDGSDAPATESLGSGFIITADGDVLTNYHVVENAESITVKLNDRRVLPAKIVGVDPQSDLALLKINASGLPVASISDKPVRVGQWVLAIGSPFGFDHSVTVGIVSAEGRSIGDEQYVPYLQTDVPINPGSSGGPLFNLQGQVVGINSEIYSRSGGYQGVSFAIPANLAMQVAQQLRQHGHVTRGWLGVSIVDVQPSLAAFLHMSRPEGALVRKVAPASPAARAGFKAGDVILSYNGMDVVSSEELPPLVGSTPVGRDVSVTVMRNHQQTILRVRVGLLPASGTGELMPADALPGSGFDSLGLAIRPLTQTERRQFRLKEGGVVVDQVSEGAGRRAGFKPGDVVLMMNGTAVTGLRQFQRLEGQLSAAHPVPVLVQRPGTTLFLPLQTSGS